MTIVNRTYEIEGVPVPQLLDAHAVAQYLDCTVTSVKRMIVRGEIPGTRVGKRWFVRVDVLNALFPQTSKVSAQ